MLETNLNNCSERKKSHVYLKTETKGDDIREEIKDNTISIISVQSKSFKVHAETLKEKLNYALKEANNVKLYKKEGKYQVLNAQEWMGKTILKLTTLKISARLNMQQLIEEHDEVLNAAKDNGTTKTVKEVETFRQILKDKEGDVMENWWVARHNYGTT